MDNIVRNLKKIRHSIFAMIIDTVIGVAVIYYAITGIQANWFLSFIIIAIGSFLLLYALALLLNLADVKKMTNILNGLSELPLSDFTDAMNTTTQKTTETLKRIFNQKYFIGYVDDSIGMVILQNSAKFDIEEYNAFLEKIQEEYKKQKEARKKEITDRKSARKYDREQRRKKKNEVKCPHCGGLNYHNGVCDYCGKSMTEVKEFRQNLPAETAPYQVQAESEYIKYHNKYNNYQHERHNRPDDDYHERYENREDHHENQQKNNQKDDRRSIQLPPKSELVETTLQQDVPVKASHFEQSRRDADNNSKEKLGSQIGVGNKSSENEPKQGIDLEKTLSDRPSHKRHK